QSPAPSDREPSLGELVSQLSEQTSRLVRDELRLAQAEMTAKGKKAGIGAALFGGAGLMALYGVACLVAAAILALAGPVPDWAAALIVGGVLLAVGGVAALIGKRDVSQATPPVPAEAVAGLKQDLHTLKPGDHS
ncbi:MAG: phage holin family protein, partial [Jatrophihabitans sp.]